MDDRTRSALLWGAVGGLAFAVLAQGYNAFGPGGITAGVLAGVAVVVAAVVTAAAYAVDRPTESERA